MISFHTHPDQYRHWKLSIEPPIAILAMDVDAEVTLRPGYELKLNSYDLGVDIELYDAVQRLRFEHPEVGAVILTSAKPDVFCAGANIRMLAGSSHDHKVNFCKFTNETRNGIEDATDFSHQTWLCAINGTAAGGGYELAEACDWIIMADDNTTAVSLPEVPLLAVLPGTGGLTRLVDKRKVRRDHADFFCTVTEGIKGTRARDWKLIDELAPRTGLMEAARARALEFAAKSDRPHGAKGIRLTPLARTIDGDTITYAHISCEIDRERGIASVRIRGPQTDAPGSAAAIHAEGDTFWPLAFARELDDFLLHMRLNETEAGIFVIRTHGELNRVAAYDTCLAEHADDWLVREVTLYLKRTLKRLDVTSRSIFALIEPGSCFAGSLLEIALGADRSYMLDGTFEDSDLPPATIMLTAANFGTLPMVNGLSRLESRFLGDPGQVEQLRQWLGEPMDAGTALEHGLVTFAPDDIDWEDEVRVAVEERASFSPDAMTGMEANLRFGGPETLESKIFARLTAWQNWIFQRPNAAGEQGALRAYGTGRKSKYDRKRV
ncbi:MAG: benzoyl-CoA-dihydrodiol lyase [Gammaproteobacteria bacterium]|nr:benzoyl-CoA-dihydrodiol lyase [Gammaproteobacteria bacterium]